MKLVYLNLIVGLLIGCGGHHYYSSTDRKDVDGSYQVTEKINGRYVDLSCKDVNGTTVCKVLY